MMGRHSISLSIDEAAGAAYLKLSEEPVARTVQFDDATLVDLDRYDMVVGFECLDLNADVDLDALAKQYHIEAKVLTFIRSVADSIDRRRTTASASPTSVTPEYGTIAVG